MNFNLNFFKKQQVMSAPVPFSSVGRYNPQASLSSQPVEIQKLIASHLSVSDSQQLFDTDSNFRKFSNSKKRLDQQRKQWQLMLQGQLTDNFGQNEALIRSYGGRTLNLTKQERAAWKAAYKSLTKPPPKLSAAQRMDHIRRFFPNLHGIMTQEHPRGSKEERRSRLIYYSSVSRRESLSTRWEDTENDRTDPGRPLTDIALQSRSFLGFLRAFSIDGDRFLLHTEHEFGSIVGFLTAPSYREKKHSLVRALNADWRIKSVPGTKIHLTSEQRAKNLMLLQLVIRGQGALSADPLGFIELTYIQSKAAIPMMLRTGWDFSQTSMLDDDTLHLGGSQFGTLFSMTVDGTFWDTKVWTPEIVDMITDVVTDEMLKNSVSDAIECAKDHLESEAPHREADQEQLRQKYGAEYKPQYYPVTVSLRDPFWARYPQAKADLVRFCRRLLARCPSLSELPLFQELE